MTRLLHDRYYAYAEEHAWDLATGESVPVGDLVEAAPSAWPPLAEPLSEVLNHGRDGEPRWVVLETAAGASSPSVVGRAAEEARVRGLVPIAAEVYLRLRSLLEAELVHRTLMLILRPGEPLELGRQAFVQAAACSPRPHVLLSFRTERPLSGRTSGYVVREARAAYGAGRSESRIPDAEPRLSDDVLRHIARGARWSELCQGGRHAAAERLLRDVAGALVRRKALVPAAEALITLGRLLLERGRASDAESVFGEAAAQGQVAKDNRVSIGARLWQAAARTDTAQLTAAESLCRAALVAGGLAGGERGRAEATLARILLWQGRVDEAAARELHVEPEEDEVNGFIGATEVRVLLAQGNVFRAGQRARSLLDRAETSRHPLARVIALAAQTRVLMESGDLVLAEQRLTDVRIAARAARTPLRSARLRVLWVDTLRRAGRARDAERELQDLRRLRGVTPPLLRAAIEDRLRGETRAAPRAVVSVAAHSAAASMVAMARDEEKDREAVRRVLAFTAESVELNQWQ